MQTASVVPTPGTRDEISSPRRHGTLPFTSSNGNREQRGRSTVFRQPRKPEAFPRGPSKRNQRNQRTRTELRKMGNAVRRGSKIVNSIAVFRPTDPRNMKGTSCFRLARGRKLPGVRDSSSKAGPGSARSLDRTTRRVLATIIDWNGAEGNEPARRNLYRFLASRLEKAAGRSYGTVKG